MNTHAIELEVMNNPTILTRVIQIISRRRIALIEFSASLKNADDEEGSISIKVMTNNENVILIKNQFQKLVDVIKVA